MTTTTMTDLQQSPIAQHVNFYVLCDRMGGDLGAVIELLELFADYAPTSLESLRTAARSGDTEQIRENAHRFKGSCKQIDAAKLGGLLLSLEQKPSQSDTKLIEQITTITNQLCADIHTFCC